jgi:hypothetical protein
VIIDLWAYEVEEMIISLGKFISLGDKVSPAHNPACRYIHGRNMVTPIKSTHISAHSHRTFSDHFKHLSDQFFPLQVQPN